MHPREHSLASRETLRRVVRRSVARAVENAREGELVETLAWELSRALRAEGTALRGAVRSGILAEVRLAGFEEVAAAEHALATAQGERPPSPEGGAGHSAVAPTEPEGDELALHRSILDDAHEAMVRRARSEGLAQDDDLRADLDALFARAASGELPLDLLREEIQERVQRAATEGRERMLAAWSLERDRRMDVLRRRLDKVNRLLESSEQALGRLGAGDPGLRSIYRTVQGLDALTPDAARKRLLLAEIYRANLELRRRESA